MNKLQHIYHISMASFLNRIRDKSIIIITLFMMYMTYLFFPQKNASISFTLNIGGEGSFYRGIYNSMWLGWVGTIIFIVMMPLLGFYFVNNSIKKERQLLIGELSASMPVKSWVFIFGKAFGNFMFLLIQMGVVVLITFIMQFIRGESHSIEIVKLMIPFIIFAIPVCLIVAVIAITFENIPFLGDTLGNVVYFFMWMALIVMSLESHKSVFTDVFGIRIASNKILEQLSMNFKELKNIDNFSFGPIQSSDKNLKTFVMDKVDLGHTVLFERLMWIVVAILFLFLVAMIFRRTTLLAKKDFKKSVKLLRETSHKYENKSILTAVSEFKSYSNNLSIIKGELKLILSIPSIWWYAVIVTLSLGILFSTKEVMNKFFIPMMWISPIFIWSSLGSHQRNFKMEDYLFIYGNYRGLQVINSFIAGVIFTIFINSAVIVKFMITNNFKGALYIAIGSFFITALGVFIGNATGSSTLFEIIYILLWYIGVLNGMPYLDFIGINEKASNSSVPFVFLILGALALINSVMIRNYRIKKLYNS